MSPRQAVAPLVPPQMVAASHVAKATRTQELCARRRKSQQAEREYEKIKSQLEGLEESVRDRCKKEFTGVPPRGVQPACRAREGWPGLPHLASRPQT